MVQVNTTAVDLNLGTGGNHFIVANLNRKEETYIEKPGHIMKLRYTPLQFKVNSIEEEYFDILNSCNNLKGQPVIVLELHSMLLPAAVIIKNKIPKASIVYIMTDGGSLPIALSKQVDYLKKHKIIDHTITSGHSFGGDLEAVNIYTALLGAKYVLDADFIIVAMGPGVLGTGTQYGFTGIEVGENINKVNLLKGFPITCPRISFKDPRTRHRGISHHSITNFKEVAITSANIALPEIQGEGMQEIISQLKKNGLPGIHNFKWHNTEEAVNLLKEFPFKIQSMGRSIEEDPIFFASASATGIEAVEYYKKTEKG